MEIRVNTPQGVKFHGEVVDKKFVRQVDWSKDRMRIFDAWSIHPDALKQIIEMGIEQLEYVCGDQHYFIKLDLAREKGFEKEFSGGKTFYIPIKFWNIGNLNTLL